MKTYRVAILGCRGRGTAAARGYHAHPRAEVVGLCDLIKERRDTLGDMLGVSARFADLDEMIVQTSPDIVAIPTGTEFHYELCMRVLEHGVNIDVEKPMCIDLEQADDVMAKAVEKGAEVAVHHQGRVGSCMKAAEKAVQEGRIGEIRYIYGSGKGYYAGYGLMNIGTHTINDILNFTGRCRSVNAIGLTDGHRITPEDVVPSPSGMGTIACEHITASLEFDNNVTATLLQHRFGKMDSTAYSMQLYGTEGRIWWKNSGAWLMSQPHLLPDGTHDKWQALDPIHPEGYDPQAGEDYAYADEYIKALDEDRDHRCSGSEALHTIEIMMGIFESAAYGIRVDLPQERRDHPLLRWRAEAGLGAPEPMPRGYGEWLAVEDERLAKRRSE
ncbi:Gfo/Idh/MocA family protein [Candidatus Poribacteria bacterium]